MKHPSVGNVAIACLLLVAGCATTSDDPNEPREERIYRTGSNLPMRDMGNVHLLDAETVRDNAHRAQQPRPGTN